MTPSSLPPRLAAVRERLAVSPAELVALGVLLAGALAVLAALWALTPDGEPAAAEDRPDDAPQAGLEGQAAAGSGEADGAGAGVALATGSVVVHVAGAVADPGVHEVPADARIADVIAAAGGATEDAWLDGLNLARTVQDGEQLVVPDADAVEHAEGGQAGEVAPAGTAAGDAVRPDGRIDVNRASATELEALPGVGPVLAERIVSHRDAHGPFAAPADLLDVAGIGETRLEALRDLLDL